MKNNIFSPAWVHKKYYLGRMDKIDIDILEVMISRINDTSPDEV